MKKIAGFTLLIIGLTFFSCKKDGEPITIHLQLLYDGDPMVMQQEYAYPDGKTFIATKVSMYLSDINLEGSVKSLSIADVAFVNFSESHRTAESASEGYLLYNDKVDFGSIESLQFNVGLTPEQNRTVPADYASGTPLAMPGEYWLAWDSFIFVKIEGRIDLDGDGITEEGVALHLGSDQVMQSFSLANTNGSTALTVAIDISKIFANDKIYDIGANPQIHSLSQMPSLLELSENLSHAIFLK
jgi:hypothetical protein